MRKIFALLMLMLLGLPAASAVDFVAGTTYYIDGKGTNFLGDGAVIKVKTGSTEVSCTSIGDSKLSFVPAQTCTTVNIIRYNSSCSTAWNTTYNVPAPSNAATFIYKMNSNLTSGSWVAYNSGSSSSGTTPKAWIISKNVNGWSNTAVSSEVFTYNETTKKYTITVSPDKLRSDTDNGFKIGYDVTNDWNSIYGAEATGDLVSGTAKKAQKSNASNNFYLPASATGNITLVFDQVNSTLTATWGGGNSGGGESGSETTTAAELWLGGNPFGGFGKKTQLVWNGSAYATYTFSNYDSDQYFSFYTKNGDQMSCKNDGIAKDGSQMTATASTNACKIPANSGKLKLTVVSYDESAKEVVFTVTVVTDGDDDDNNNNNNNNEGNGFTDSGKLPRMYITTDAEMLDRNLADKEYRSGTYYIVDKDGNALLDGVTEANQLPLEIKARGNYTRTGFSKKPFKLKLGKKQALLGMTKSKHYALLAHADDDKGYLKNFVGFWLGQKIFPNGEEVDGTVREDVFTPHEEPIELYLNGKYWGLYFLTESIRVGDDRIRIEELDDKATDPALISGGYVVELDNYGDDNQIVMDEKGNWRANQKLRITPDTPEIYSDAQRKFVAAQFSRMNELVGTASDDLWKNMDLDMAARYYVVMEILGHYEAYHGSTYLYRDRGEGKKWMFAPLWDCGHALESTSGWLYNDSRSYGNTWIQKMLTNQKFKNKVVETYKWFWGNKVGDLYTDMEAYVKRIEDAAKQDRLRWKDEPLPTKYDDPLNNYTPTNPTAVINNSDLVSKFTSEYKPTLQARINWINQQWSVNPSTSDNEPAWNTEQTAPLPYYVKEGYVDGLIPEDETGVYPVFFEGKSNETNLYAYVYGNAEPCGAWPGQACQKITIEGKEYWYTIIDAGYNRDWNIIFTNNSSWQYPANGSTTTVTLVKRGIYKENGYTNSTITPGNYGEVTDPDNPDNPDDPDRADSGELPRLYITAPEAVEDRNLADKDYRAGKYYLVDKDGTALVGSEEAPLDMEIKARGNYTRTGFSKKPFKLKLGKKQSLLGMTSSKHYAILAHADDDKGYLKNYVGFWLGQQIFPDGEEVDGVKREDVFTPREEPVEVYINGKYWGLYFLTESIRIGDDRIKIEELGDNVWDPAQISGGYLVELDNYDEGGQQIKLQDPTDYNKPLIITPDTPEIYSDIQKKFVKEQFETMNGYAGSHSDELWKYMDLDMAARYYVVMEIIGHWEAYHGSTYLYRDRGEGKKWMFSPLWDCGHALEYETGWITEIGNPNFGNSWIKGFKQNTQFMSKVKDTYAWFMGNKIDNLYTDMEAYVKKIEKAAKKDHARWGDAALPIGVNGNATAVKDNSDLVSKYSNEYKPLLEKRIKWLNQQWNVNPSTSCAEPAWNEIESAPLPDYAKEGYEVEAPDAWIVSKKANGWSEKEKGDSKFTFDLKKGTYSITVDASMLSYEGNQNGFKIGYNTTGSWDNIWGAPKDDTDPLENGKKKTVVKAGDSANLYLPDGAKGDITIVFDYVGGTVKASWSEEEEPVDPDPEYPWGSTNDPDMEISMTSGNLPVLYIMSKDDFDLDTLDASDESKKKKIASYYWLDPKTSGVDAIGSKAEPKELTMKGRGNWTWKGYAKKPFKITFSEAQEPCGMKSAKAFGLLAAADDTKAFLRNTVGFKLAKEFGLPWTPDQYPVEVIFNGKYRGMYMLTDLIEIGEDRVNITPWGKTNKLDESGNPILDADGKNVKIGVEGGTIVEIDNYDDANQIRISDNHLNKEGQYEPLRFTYDKSVEDELTPAGYKDKLTTEFSTINQLIGQKSANVWNYIDIDDAARFILVQEMMGNYESFHGSCYLHKDLGEGKKWHFSPVWDFGSSFNYFDQEHFYKPNPKDDEHFNHWVADLVQIEGMTEKLAEHLGKLTDAKMTEINSYIDAFIAQITTAAAKDKTRWPDYGTNNFNGEVSNVKTFLSKKRTWLLGQYNVETPVDPTDAPDAWVISKNTEWNLTNKTNKFSYDKTNKVYTITLDVSKVRTDDGDNGFKIGYDNVTGWGDVYGPNDTNKNIELSNGTAVTMIKQNGTKNFTIPASVVGNVTLTFNAANGSITASWETGDEPGPDEPTDGFIKGTTYYLDGSACSYFTKDSAKIRVWDGAKENDVTFTEGSKGYFTVSKNCSTVEIRRIDPKDASKIWNKTENVPAPKDASKYVYVYGDSFNDGGTWKLISGEEEPEDPTSVPEAWIISQNVNGWNNGAVSDYKFTYVRRAKVYVLNILKDKISDGFKIGYDHVNDWGSVLGGSSNDTMKKDEDKALGFNTNNLKLPNDAASIVTLILDVENKNLIVTWNTDNQDMYTHNLIFIDRHSQKWENVSVYVYSPLEELGAWPGQAMTKTHSALPANGPARAQATDNVWTHTFDSYTPAEDLVVIYNNTKADASADSEETDEHYVLATSMAHVRTDSGLTTEAFTPITTGIEAVGADGFSISVMNGMLVVNSEVEMLLPIVTVDGQMMMIEITPGITMIGLDHGVYIVNGRKYAL